MADGTLPRAIMIGCVTVGVFAAWPLVGQDRVEFRTEIAPLLQQHCLRCHSPGIKKGDVSLATVLDLRSHGYLVPGDVESSYLIDLVAGVDGEAAEMPKEGKPLSAESVALFKRWVREGAEWPDDVVIREQSKADATWWAYQPLRETSIQSIDEFVHAKLAAKGLEQNRRADRRTLIRRATYDLIGLPPTPEEVAAFVSNPDPQAYEQLIDRLLASPHYGERWGRHWLDVVRFGESNGFERNVIINELWPFRDYVIRSLNADKPFDQMIREQIAGDVMADSSPETAVATAFLVAGPYDNVGNQDAEQAAQIRANTLDEMIRATSESLLGLTVGCARCHDHKFDPITQEDYYGLYATFAGVRHGAVPLSTAEARRNRAAKLAPLNREKSRLQGLIAELDAKILARAKSKLPEYQSTWPREPIDRLGTEDRFEPVTVKWVRLVCEAQDGNPKARTGFRIDEFEVWSADDPKNVALAEHGGKATGQARKIEDFPGAYGAHHVIDGKVGARFLATGTDLTIELAEPTRIDRVVFSSARGESTPAHRKFVFVAEYRIEVSDDGKNWRTVASSADRRPVPKPAFLNHRLMRLETAPEDRVKKAELQKQIAEIDRKIARVPSSQRVWIGSRNEADAKGPFHVFVGGSPQRRGDPVAPASLSVLNTSLRGTSSDEFSYRLPATSSEADRRKALADWLVHPDNPLTPRVLANRLWHYHFGTGIVETPSDFGYMGGRPSHPELLDFLALQLKANGWRLKPLHRMIMLSETYRQSSDHRERAARLDGEARLLWRFPPRRLSAEEIRDTMLSVAGKLDRMPAEANQQSDPDSLVPDGGPGFRLYRVLSDNVSTYIPLDAHGPETYRRAVYHQNARASVVDLMTDFDQPDCTVSAPRRAATTTPLQALTMLNHNFTFDMATALGQRIRDGVGDDPEQQINRLYSLCYSRQPSPQEVAECGKFLKQHGLTALCRVILNTSEMIYVQ